MIKELLIFLTTFLLAAALFPRLASIASRIGLVDVPNRRKTHGSPKPLVGGIGMAMALAVSCLAFVPLTNLRGFYAGFVLLIIIP
jgi:UDP-GlcNAc:undecaprenyl-phosphate GlcNAc-1-phosphate transferase